MELKQRIEDYTDAEFLELVREFFENRSGLTGKEYGQYIDRLMIHFVTITEHPGKSDVICYPTEGEEDSPEGVLKRVKEWRAANGKPGFKPA
ncbi:bacteriocin immunity protein [Pseudomonas rubra]|uniref:Bacteriocin immunity protein n=1 Tax=Pseudomonas rubra TaxID=2942627 RepID=A0ABT5PE56_9PSED|nr:bacteriocin immunity protein [Pseudomonas rubra]MDD1016293.1 bacteriocin immunity protein [Pseudomonas rubra]MDD1041356.1 bacteriocin immunity protein [Pseudomonas rubra]MDD1153339.1 bacteriocin immunity protein [Pseudomonas rubra]